MFAAVDDVVVPAPTTNLAFATVFLGRAVPEGGCYFYCAGTIPVIVATDSIHAVLVAVVQTIKNRRAQ